MNLLPLLCVAPWAPLLGSSAPDDGALVRFAPPSAAAWVETVDHVPLLEQGVDHPAVAGFLDLPIVRIGAKLAPEELLAAGEAIFGAPPLGIALDLTSGGFAVGVAPTENGPRSVFVLRGTSDLDRYEDALEALVAGISARPLGARECEELGVQEAWRFARRSTRIARYDERTLVIAQRQDDLHASLAAARGLEVHVALAAHAQDERRGGTFAWLDLARIEAEAGLGDLRAVQGDPAAHLLLGPVLTHLAGSDQLSARFDFDAARITADVLGTGVERRAAAPTFPAPDAEALALPIGPAADDWLRFEGHRDLQAFLAGRADLLHPRLLPEVAEGLANLALLTGESDEERLARVLGQEFLLLARPIDFGGHPRPEVVLPAVVLAARLSDPEEDGPWILRAFQRGAAFAGVERTQKGRPGVLLGVEPLDPDAADAPTIWTARIDPPNEGDLVDIQYNLAPACVVVGDVAVLGTHVDAVRDVARRVRAETESAAPGSIDRLTLEGPAVARVVARNADVLATRAVLLEGKPRARAEAELTTLERLFAGVRRLTLATDGHIVPERHLTARLTLELEDR